MSPLISVTSLPCAVRSFLDLSGVRYTFFSTHHLPTLRPLPNVQSESRAAFRENIASRRSADSSGCAALRATQPPVELPLRGSWLGYATCSKD